MGKHTKIPQSREHLKFCPDHYTEIENYELAKADDFVGWICHHRNGEQFSKEWLIANNMYFNRTDPHEFKFVTVNEHKQIHGALLGKSTKGRHHTDEAKAKIGAFNKGKPKSEEHRRKLAEAQTGKPSWSKGKHLSDEHRKRLSDARKAYFARIKGGI